MPGIYMRWWLQVLLVDEDGRPVIYTAVTKASSE